MVRRAEGWKLRQDRRTGTQFVRFRHETVRYEISTGERDEGKAAPKAAAIYAEVVSGRWGRRIVAGTPGADFGDVAAEWLIDVASECVPKTHGLYVLHVRTHLAPFFGTIDRMTDARIGDYRRARLRQVLRTTVNKELATLRRFLRWCVDEKYIQVMPKVESVPPSVLGTEDTKRRHKRKSIPVSAGEAKAIIASLPEFAKRARRGKNRHRVRDFFAVLWETGLRPETVEAIKAPVHYRRRGKELHITKDIDKVRYDRELPLTKAARAALDRCALEAGLIFGSHDFRVPFREACRAAAKAGKLASWKAEKVTPYDFRHGRTTDLLDQPDATLPGVAYVVGHKQITTTNRYVHAPKKAAEAVLLGGIRGAARSRVAR
jgi:integrase